MIKMTPVRLTLHPGTSVKMYLVHGFCGHWFGDGSPTLATQINRIQHVRFLCVGLVTDLVNQQEV
jgi:hypothetical protein